MHRSFAFDYQSPKIHVQIDPLPTSSKPQTQKALNFSKFHANYYDYAFEPPELGIWKRYSV
jgi:hypothetical protein